MRSKGIRQNKTHHGERVHTAKLTADDVRIIDRLLCDGLSIRSIASKFEVSHNCVWDISRGYTWKHITGARK